jgi:hypothetical protein
MILNEWLMMLQTSSRVDEIQEDKEGVRGAG